jgi:hypothetical protein
MARSVSDAASRLSTVAIWIASLSLAMMDTVLMVYFTLTSTLSICGISVSASDWSVSGPMNL